MVTFALIIALAATALDAVTTCIGIKRGYIEANPLAPHGITGAVTVNVFIALALLVPFLLWRDSLTGPVPAIVLCAYAGLRSYAAIRNIRTMREGK